MREEHVAGEAQRAGRLDDKVAIVTGGLSGIGAAIAARFVEEGAEVIVTDVDLRRGQEIARELGARFLEHDAGDEEAWIRVVKAVERLHGRIDILVNNAGIGGPFEAADPESTTMSDWRAVHRVNVEGVFMGCRAVIGPMRRVGGGSIVNVSSTAALVGTADFVGYGASKAAVMHLTKSVALHAAPDRIRCNSIHPGVVLTPLLRRICDDLGRRRGISGDAVLEEFRTGTPLGELQTPEDIANAALFLASDEARSITATSLVIDGGGTAGRARMT